MVHNSSKIFYDVNAMAFYNKIPFEECIKESYV